ncbi:predicted protein [Chaetoceros tenuissimus]|uniref:Uncharacterized protein n=1 Tax=Chaetoceros tenuissimus TaxID=426638 RepID=A0AAD3D5D2_9STRA|nr:predicted protein [Chaetoceros tenuissimus]
MSSYAREAFYSLTPSAFRRRNRNKDNVSSSNFIRNSSSRGSSNRTSNTNASNSNKSRRDQEITFRVKPDGQPFLNNSMMSQITMSQSLQNSAPFGQSQSQNTSLSMNLKNDDASNVHQNSQGNANTDWTGTLNYWSQASSSNASSSKKVSGMRSTHPSSQMKAAKRNVQIRSQKNVLRHDSQMSHSHSSQEYTQEFKSQPLLDNHILNNRNRQKPSPMPSQSSSLTSSTRKRSWLSVAADVISTPYRRRKQSRVVKQQPKQEEQHQNSVPSGPEQQVQVQEAAVANRPPSTSFTTPQRSTKVTDEENLFLQKLQLEKKDIEKLIEELTTLKSNVKVQTDESDKVNQDLKETLEQAKQAASGAEEACSEMKKGQEDLQTIRQECIAQCQASKQEYLESIESAHAKSLDRFQTKLDYKVEEAENRAVVNVEKKVKAATTSFQDLLAPLLAEGKSQVNSILGEGKKELNDLRDKLCLDLNTEGDRVKEEMVQNLTISQIAANARYVTPLDPVVHREEDFAIGDQGFEDEILKHEVASPIIKEELRDRQMDVLKDVANTKSSSRKEGKAKSKPVAHSKRTVNTSAGRRSRKKTRVNIDDQEHGVKRPHYPIESFQIPSSPTQLEQTMMDVSPLSTSVATIEDKRRNLSGRKNIAKELAQPSSDTHSRSAGEKGKVKKRREKVKRSKNAKGKGIKITIDMKTFTIVHATGVKLDDLESKPSIPKQTRYPLRSQLTSSQESEPSSLGNGQSVSTFQKEIEYKEDHTSFAMGRNDGQKEDTQELFMSKIRRRRRKTYQKPSTYDLENDKYPFSSRRNIAMTVKTEVEKLDSLEEIRGIPRAHRKSTKVFDFQN